MNHYPSRQNSTPKDFHILNPGICKFVVTLYDKGDLTYGIMLKYFCNEMTLYYVAAPVGLQRSCFVRLVLFCFCLIILYLSIAVDVQHYISSRCSTQWLDIINLQSDHLINLYTWKKVRTVRFRDVTAERRLEWWDHWLWRWKGARNRDMWAASQSWEKK